MHTLENDVLKISISEHGAEVQSIYNKRNNREYLWQGDETYWNRRSPILFPIVGKLANNTYYVKGKDYHLTQHGFARDMNFEVVEKRGDYVKFKLKANEQTMLFYPYNFKLTVSYRLEENKLTTKFKVYNNSSELMYFSIGAHPAFNTNLSEKGIEDYYLDFEKEKTLKSKVVDKEVNLITNEETLVMENQDKLNLRNAMFEDNTLIFENIDKVTLKNNINDEEVKLTCHNFPLLGLWTRKKEDKCPYICIEPWYGIADYVGGPREISDKAYIQSVIPDDKFVSKYTIEIK
ncbi:aldose 1-epimerase family protein [Mycoplasmatota bacterium]|nr:aldose 1-epimerase family protein [Mycoplasmatota bacterium]